MKEGLVTIEHVFRKVGKENKHHKKPMMPKIKKDKTTVRKNLPKVEYNDSGKLKNTKISHTAESTVNITNLEEPKKIFNNLGSSTSSTTNSTNLDGGTF